MLCTHEECTRGEVVFSTLRLGRECGECHTGKYKPSEEGLETEVIIPFARHEGGAENWGLQAKIYGSDVADYDEFGHSVSMDGDYVAVGCPGDDDHFSASGAAYVFHRNEGGANNWGEVKKVISSDGAGWDEFGHSVSIDGDEIVAGAPMDDDNGLQSGSVYLYELSALLPVELVSFTALADGDGVILNWVTASETENAGFEVEQRREGGPVLWVSRGFVEGHGTTTETQRYTYRVGALEPGAHVMRLKQVDFDGTAAYSANVSLVVDSPVYTLYPAYPNPFNPVTTIRYVLPRPADVTLIVYDSIGRQVRLLWSGQQPAGSFEATFDASGLSSGVYVYRLDADGWGQTNYAVLLR